jgi:hypothetical protein
MKIDRAIGELNELYEHNGHKPILAPGDLGQTNWINDQDIPHYFQTTLSTGQVLRAHFRLLPNLLMSEHTVVSFSLDSDAFPWEAETSKIKGQTVRHEIEALITALSPLAKEIIAQDKIRRHAAYTAREARLEQAEIERYEALLRADKPEPKN